MDEIQRLKAKQKYGTESVLIVPGFSVSQIPDGFLPADSKIRLMEKSRHVLRYDAESNPALVQLITCSVIRNRIDDRFFTCKTAEDDQRAKGKWSLLIGGHISNIFWDAQDIAMHCVKSQMAGKLHMIGMKTPQLMGYCRDRTGPVPDCLGIVYETYVNSAGMRDMSPGRYDNWVTLQELANMYGAYDEWSKYLIDHYYKQEKEQQACANSK